MIAAAMLASGSTRTEAQLHNLSKAIHERQARTVPNVCSGVEGKLELLLDRSLGLSFLAISLRLRPTRTGASGHAAPCRFRQEARARSSPSIASKSPALKAQDVRLGRSRSSLSVAQQIENPLVRFVSLRLGDACAGNRYARMHPDLFQPGVPRPASWQAEVIRWIPLPHRSIE